MSDLETIMQRLDAIEKTIDRNSRNINKLSKRQKAAFVGVDAGGPDWSDVEEPGDENTKGAVKSRALGLADDAPRKLSFNLERPDEDGESSREQFDRLLNEGGPDEDGATLKEVSRDEAYSPPSHRVSLEHGDLVLAPSPERAEELVANKPLEVAVDGETREQVLGVDDPDEVQDVLAELEREAETIRALEYAERRRDDRPEVIDVLRKARVRAIDRAEFRERVESLDRP